VTRRLAVALTAALTITAPSVALGDPEPLPTEHVVVRTEGATVVVPGEPSPRIFGLPVGSHLLTPPSWERLDVEFKRLQEAETRLRAENDSFRKTAASWQPGWKILLTTLVVGVAGGVYLGTRF